GLIILLVAPVLALLTGPLLRPLQKAQTQERSRHSELTSMATDIVAGLRILRGIGGEPPLRRTTRSSPGGCAKWVCGPACGRERSTRQACSCPAYSSSG